MVHYYRTTPDGRIAFGKGGGRLAYDARIGGSFTGRSAMESELTARLRTVYPSFAAVPIASSWTGPIDRTVDGLPFFARLGRPDLVCGAGYSGNGVGPSILGGRILASMALGLDDDDLGRGVELFNPQRRPQPGEATADDAHLGPPGARELGDAVDRRHLPQPPALALKLVPSRRPRRHPASLSYRRWPPVDASAALSPTTSGARCERSWCATARNAAGGTAISPRPRPRRGETW